MPRTWRAVLARMGTPTGDGRILDPAGAASRDLPLPLSWQQMSGDGHGGSQIVARIESLSFDNGMVTATGTMLDSAPWEVFEQIEAGVIGPSVDLDDLEYVMDDQERLVLTKWRVAGATLVSIPAFAEVSITLDPEPVQPLDTDAGIAERDAAAGRLPRPMTPEEGAMIGESFFNGQSLAAFGLAKTLHTFERSPHSGAGNCSCGMAEQSAVHPHAYVAADTSRGQEPGCLCAKQEDDPIHDPGLTASLEVQRAPTSLPPLDWFMKPDLDRLTPLTVSDTGRVFGHIAGWESCHVGLPGCVTPPSSYSNYSYFLQSSQPLADGTEIPVGTLVAGPRHADAQLAFHAATQHYDDPSAAVARVTAGEDEFGIWVAGWLLPTATETARQTFMTSPVSGDWRRVGGNLELIAVCSVNSAGFPIPKARVAFSNGAQRTLIGTFGVQPVTGTYDRPETHAFGNKYVFEAMARARWAWSQTKGR